ncbi:MAG: hypothetical protein HUU21_17540, partial [Polyangiaceae bacterium]|nr:hypothetical protein [Polyangiaceae bacterium]
IHLSRLQIKKPTRAALQALSVRHPILSADAWKLLDSLGKPLDEIKVQTISKESLSQLVELSIQTLIGPYVLNKEARERLGKKILTQALDKNTAAESPPIEMTFSEALRRITVALMLSEEFLEY